MADDVAQWRADMLATAVRTNQLLEALLQSQQATLIGLAEVKSLLVVEETPEEGEEPSAPTSVAELLAELVGDVSDAATKAGFLEAGPDDDGGTDEP